MQFRLSQRTVFTLGFVLCVALIATALYLQHAGGLEPCPLCILQRIAVMGIGLVLLAGAVHNPKAWSQRVYGVLTLIIAAAGLVVAGRHVWLQSTPRNAAECGIGLGDMIDMFPLSKTLELVFRGSGDCTETLWTFLGLSIPGWMIVVFSGFAILGILLTFFRVFLRPGVREDDAETIQLD